jgi:NAD(P)-dependent dehydrogenase (short-subunit alcohol dehydrogenase family)
LQRRWDKFLETLKRRTQLAASIHPLFDLSGRVAVVTGGGSGLGREFCDALAEFGADVVTVSRHRDHDEETCKIIRKHGRRALAVEADVSQYEQVQAVFKEVDKNFGKLDILVNNAGIIPQSALIDGTSVNDWQRVIGIDLNGVFYCMKEGLKIMLRQKKGSIINISSINGVNANYPDINILSPYVTAKAGVIGLTKQGAVEYAQSGIRVNCISPGWFLGTNLGPNSGAVMSEEQYKAFKGRLVERTPMHRTAEPSEIKGTLLYLASDASSFVTGQTIIPDGGWTAW